MLTPFTRRLRPMVDVRNHDLRGQRFPAIGWWREWLLSVTW